MQRILENEPAEHVDATLAAVDTDDDDNDPVGFQQNSIRATDLDDLDFGDCIETPAIRSVTIPVADENIELPASDTIHFEDAPNTLLLRRLAEKYDRKRHH